MVMETPGPQEVGREFVRQYYTMLHEAPLHLHRFYSNNSAFVHGGVEKAGNEQPPVIGQENIHKKIVSLGFRDCHAKIRQVDAQSTVGDAVVVQVTGELSNNGEPMRRFMQSFVLVPQSPKMFYVHNDIFRYQDEVFQDEDGETEDADRFITDPRVDESVDNEPIQTPDASPPHFEHISNGSTSLEAEPVEAVVEPVPEVVTITPQSNKVELDLSPYEKDSGVSEEHAQVETDSPYEAAPEPAKPVTVIAPVAEPDTSDFPELSAPPVAESNKPVSWAALASKNTLSGLPPPPTAASFPAPVPHHSNKHAAPRPVEPVPKPIDNNSAPAPQPQRSSQRPAVKEPEREKHIGGQGDGSFNDLEVVNGRRSTSTGGSGGVGSRFPDNQQLFVGNLSQDITDAELKDFFERYGKVEELRINTKSGGGKVPNFGFVVFKSPETVQKILKTKGPHGLQYNNHRLNVEEKKPRGSEGMRGGRGGSRGGMGGPGVGRSGSSFGNGSSGRGGIKAGSGGFGGRGSSNAGQRGGGSQQTRR